MGGLNFGVRFLEKHDGRANANEGMLTQPICNVKSCVDFLISIGKNQFENFYSIRMNSHIGSDKLFWAASP